MALLGKNRMRRNRQPRRLRVEPLERRELLTIGLTPQGTLFIDGTSGADTAVVSRVGDHVLVKLNAESADFAARQVNRILFAGRVREQRCRCSLP
jgi:hypothetical protein